MDVLFKKVRAQSGPAVWSKGVELARLDAVTGDTETPEETRLRVVTREGGLAVTVSLYPQDLDWHCSCHDDDDPCAHVAGAIIALRRAHERGEALPKSKSQAARLAYRLTRMNGNLVLSRVVITDQSETILPGSLAALTSGLASGPMLTPTGPDLEVELAMQGERGSSLPGRVMPDLLKALARDLDVSLDGAPIKIDPSPVGLLVEVFDDGPGVRVRGKQDPEIIEVFANGAALCKTGLRAVVLPQLTPLEQEIVRNGRFFGLREFPSLVSEILGPLESKLRVKRLTHRLPGTTRVKPTLDFLLSKNADDLVILPRIVYGDPPIAEIKHGRLAPLGDGGAAPLRDTETEIRLKDELWRRHGLELEKPIRSHPDAAIPLLEKLRGSRAPVSGLPLSMFSEEAPLTPQIEVREKGFDISFVAEGKVLTADTSKVLAAWSSGNAYVSLVGEGFAKIPSDWLNLYGDRIQDLLAARLENGDVAPAARLQLARFAEDATGNLPTNLKLLREAFESFDHLPQVTLPADLNATLRPYQKTGVDWLSYVRSLGCGALLCDDMGLGKTLQVISVISGKTLIVAPTSVLPNWHRELTKFRPGLKVGLYHGAKRAIDPDADVTLTSYAIMRLDVQTLSAASWDMLVLDEAQTIKNPESRVTRAAVQIPAHFRVAMSGTPVENRLEDLWSQMHFANPGFLGDRASFSDKYTRPIENGQQHVADRLRARIKPFLLRRRKQEVAPDLPPRTEVVRYVELSPDERLQYEAILAATRRDVLAQLGAGGNVLAALEALLRLRQACCHPGLIPGSQGGFSSKLEQLVETVSEATGEDHKVLIFSQWTSFLDLMEPAFETAGLAFLRLDGSTQDRASVVDRFQDPNGPKILIMSLKAGGVGLNLTAADHVIIADPWWNPAAEDQAADRAHRIGQDRPVLVQRMVALGTVEERILALAEKKRALASSALDGGAALGLTREDLITLLD